MLFTHRNLPLLFLAVSLIVLSGSFFSAGNANALSGKEIFRRSAPAVVLIEARSGKSASQGSRSIIRSDGYVLTNAHVVFDKKRNSLHTGFYVYLKPQSDFHNYSDFQHKYLIGIPIKYSQDYDLAILRIYNPKTKKPVTNLPWLPLAKEKNIGVGSRVYALGHPGSGEYWSQTQGEIGAYKRHQQRVGYDVYQHSAAISPGNSGGPLLDTEGRQVGINTYGKLRNGAAVPGLFYAGTSETIRRWIELGMGKSFLPGRRIGKITEPYTPRSNRPAKPNGGSKNTAPPAKQNDGFDGFLKRLNK